MSQPDFQPAPYILTPIGQKKKKEQGNCLRWMVGCTLGIFMVCCVLPVSCLGGIAVVAAVAESNRVTDRSTQTLPIEDLDNITLDVRNTVGTTEIIGRSGVEEIEVEITRTATGLSDSAAQENLDKLTAVVRTEGDQYIIEASIQDSNWFTDLSVSENSIDLRIIVPAELTNLIADTEVGELSVEGVTVTEDLDLSNNIGSIVFYGTLRDGSHTISSDVGGITVTLTTGSSVEIDAASDVGEVSVESGMLDDEDRRTEGAGEQVTGVYSEESPAAGTLTVRSDVGSIRLRTR